MNTKWDLEELVEDMFAAYLRSVLPGDIKTFCANGAEKMEYPCVLVAAGDCDPVTETATHNDFRKMQISLWAMIEAVPQKEGANQVKSVRELNRWVRNAMLSAVCRSDLVAKLCPYGDEGIGVSKAQFASASRSADGDKNLIITTAIIDVIACPITT